MNDPRPLARKRHYDVKGSAACECHDVIAVQLTADPWQIDCLRCARTHAWREAAGLPEAATPSHAATMLKHGRQARFLAEPLDPDDPQIQADQRRYVLLSGRKLLWRKVGRVDAYASIRATARAWATAHGFCI
jgi:hypothetical protein